MVLMAHKLVVSKESSAFADQFIIADFARLSTVFFVKSREFLGSIVVQIAPNTIANVGGHHGSRLVRIRVERLEVLPHRFFDKRKRRTGRCAA